MKVQVDVTEQDILHGVRRCSHRCPVATAAKRTLKLAWPTKEVNIEVWARSIAIWTYNNAYEYKELSLPGKASDFVMSFDNGWPISPFSFEIEV